MALLATAGIGYNLAKDYKLDPISGAILSIVGFMLTQMTSKYTLDITNFGSTGLFTAIIMSLIAVEILRFFVKHDFVIKLPKGVPPAIANSFASTCSRCSPCIISVDNTSCFGFDIRDF